ncbi:MAG: hypothetical protein H8D56_23715 [Planctomycetes bacterium]|nr:hypothetical protein [Planctomycetota bacterium]MBL7144446.1 hypothetical protein [Phycisphaerae bacterium]
MKKRKTNQLKLWAIGVLAIVLLAAAPSAWAVYLSFDGEAHFEGMIDIGCDEGTTHLLDEDDIGIEGINIWADTTVNLYTDVSEYIYVFPGGVLNIFYCGNVEWGISLLKGDELPYPTVTVYGKNFAVDNVDVPDGTNQFLPVSVYPGSLLTGTYGNGVPIYLYFISDIPVYLQPPPSDDSELTIDIKPGSDENVINLKSCGVVPVAVLTTDDFNAGTLVPDYSILFAGASPVRSSLCDVDNDGDMDMLFHFRTQKLDLDENSTEATLTAMLKGVSMLSSATAGDVMEGTDKVKIMSSKKYSSSDKHAPKPKRYTSKHKQSSRNHKESDRNNKESGRNNKESDRNNKESNRNHKDR